MKNATRGSKAGREMVDALIGWVHLFYQKQTARRVLVAFIKRLKERCREFGAK
jgi:hypothetical protein